MQNLLKTKNEINNILLKAIDKSLQSYEINHIRLNYSEKEKGLLILRVLKRLSNEETCFNKKVNLINFIFSIGTRKQKDKIFNVVISLLGDGHLDNDSKYILIRSIFNECTKEQRRKFIPTVLRLLSDENIGVDKKAHLISLISFGGGICTREQNDEIFSVAISLLGAGHLDNNSKFTLIRSIFDKCTRKQNDEIFDIVISLLGAGHLDTNRRSTLIESIFDKCTKEQKDKFIPKILELLDGNVNMNLIYSIFNECTKEQRRKFIPTVLRLLSDENIDVDKKVHLIWLISFRGAIYTREQNDEIFNVAISLLGAGHLNNDSKYTLILSIFNKCTKEQKDKLIPTALELLKDATYDLDIRLISTIFFDCEKKQQESFKERLIFSKMQVALYSRTLNTILSQEVIDQIEPDVLKVINTNEKCKEKFKEFMRTLPNDIKEIKNCSSKYSDYFPLFKELMKAIVYPFLKNQPKEFVARLKIDRACKNNHQRTL